MKQSKTEKAVFAKLSTQKVELAEQKVELNKVKDLLSWAKKGVDVYDELAQLNRLADKFRSIAYDKLKQLEDKAQEADELRRMAQELGATDLLNSIKMAEDIMATSRKNINQVIKIFQSAGTSV